MLYYNNRRDCCISAWENNPFLDILKHDRHRKTMRWDTRYPDADDVYDIRRHKIIPDYFHKGMRRF